MLLAFDLATVPIPLWLLKVLSNAIVFVTLTMTTFTMITDTGGFPARMYVRYTSWIERQLRLMFIFVPAKKIVAGQAAALVVLLLVWVIFAIPYAYVGVVVILIAPAIWVVTEKRKRLLALEDQLDTVMLALANALKSIPSIQAAFNSVVTVITQPMQNEIDLAIKEMKLGSTLDQSLLHMAARIGSRQVDSALSAILIGRQVGGNLPKVLEQTANSLREMRRLEGNIRTKTADGRFQLWVIGALPFVFIMLLSYLMPNYFEPLTKTVTGWGISFIVVALWVTSLITARKVLAVDI
jgi:tight adherence protein B